MKSSPLPLLSNLERQPRVVKRIYLSQTPTFHSQTTISSSRVPQMEMKNAVFQDSFSKVPKQSYSPKPIYIFSERKSIDAKRGFPEETPKVSNVRNVYYNKITESKKIVLPIFDSESYKSPLVRVRNEGRNVIYHKK